ncbi:MAG: agmatine deiminase family protein [candidate division Zixibacteria bacterium]|nr:agmatine deiminase family protein [candidate division Zixibacteria bacterium]
MNKKAVLILTYLILVSSVYSYADIRDQQDFLPIGLTEEEMTRLDEIGINHRNTRDPEGEVRNPAEWERSEGVIIRWPLGISISLVAEMSEDLMVTTIVGSSSEENSARSSYTSGGVNMDNTLFIIAPTNSIWTRDYGPWFIFEDNNLAIVDPIYNRPRPYDDLIPGVIGDEWGLDVYGMDLRTPGGNHMSNGLGMSMSTELVHDENSDKTPAEIDSIMLAFLGNDYDVLDYIESGGIHHIDCWAKFLNPATILIKDVPSGDPSHNLLDARADYLSQQMSAWGRPYTIVRVYCPSGTAYTNSIILNDKVLVPIFSSSYDDDALQTYEDAMPGYEVLGFYGSWYDNDAIHCRSMGVPDPGQLYVDHDPLWGRLSDTLSQYLVSAEIISCSGDTLISDSLKILYRVDDGLWQDTPIYSTAEPDSFYGFIPGQSPGSQIEYYIKTADNSGRVETHPFIGEPWAHEFSINMPPEIVSADSFMVETGAYFSFVPTIIDEDDTVHTITYSNYPEWLSVANDSIFGVAPDITILTGFDVEVADMFGSVSQHITIYVMGEALYAYLPGDVNMYNGAWPPAIIGGDVTYLVNYFRGLETSPACYLDGYWASADANGDCLVIGSDVTKLVSFFRGIGSLGSCPDFESLWPTPDDVPIEAPDGWPNCED